MYIKLYQMHILIRHLKMAHLDKSLLNNKFRGSLVGALLGDCLGAPYEGDIISAGDKLVIQRYFDQLESPDFRAGIRNYTDDTAMMKSVAQCLIERPEFDSKYLATLFVREYFTEPNRGYGQNVVEVFKKLRQTKFMDVYRPAAEQFFGTGSYGNGGAMRIAPIALYYYNNYKNMIEVARKSTQITHTNQLGVNGALLQCISVYQALNLHPIEQSLDPQQFCNDLIEKIKAIELEDDDGLGLNDTNPYRIKMELIRNYLTRKSDEQLDEDVLVQLGNSISAYDSVPTAIYCFLRAVKNDIPTVQTDNLYRRTIQYAISLGGDTDTIASMAGAIAGAYLGIDGINPSLIKHCEYQNEIIQLADKLYNATVK